MKQDEIIEMVMQIGGCDRPEEDSPALKMFVTFANLVATKEREACAKLCETIGNTQANMNAAWRNGCRDAAIEIRARGQA
jgi:hypothetical protein